MADVERFPLSYPGDVRPLLPGDAALRRLSKQLQVASGGRVLCVGVGGLPLGVHLARELGAEVVVADARPESIADLNERLAAWGLSGQVEARQVKAWTGLPFAQGDFSAIVVDPCAPLPLAPMLEEYRPLLAPKGRLLATWPVRVGRTQQPQLARLWEQKLGEPLMLPRDVLQLLERSGYEPQIVETLEEAALDDFYRAVEERAQEGDAQAREEVALYRAQGGRSTASFAVLVGRRKEPGEKPPPSRNE